MILQEVLTSQHAAKRKSTLLVWPLVSGRTWNGRALKGKRTPCFKAVLAIACTQNVFLQRIARVYPPKKMFRNTQKGATERPSNATEAFILCFARCKNGRCSKEVPQTLKAPKRGKDLCAEHWTCMHGRYWRLAAVAKSICYPAFQSTEYILIASNHLNSAANSIQKMLLNGLLPTVTQIIKISCWDGNIPISWKMKI